MVVKDDSGDVCPCVCLCTHAWLRVISSVYISKSSFYSLWNSWKDMKLFMIYYGHSVLRSYWAFNPNTKNRKSLTRPGSVENVLSISVFKLKLAGWILIVCGSTPLRHFAFLMLVKFHLKLWNKKENCCNLIHTNDTYIITSHIVNILNSNISFELHNMFSVLLGELLTQISINVNRTIGGVR